MSEFVNALGLALHLIGSRNHELHSIVMLSLQVSLTASLFALVVGSIAGVLLAILVFPGRTAVIVVLNGLLGLPPVVVGLGVYLLLSRSGLLGSLGLLFTPQAMIVAQIILTTPIVAALVHRSSERLWDEYGDTLMVFGASLSRRVTIVLIAGRMALVTAFLTAFGRAIAEVGAIIVVGGNIRGATRTMTTAIALETSRGDLALALSLGMILIAITMAVSTIAFALNQRSAMA